MRLAVAVPAAVAVAAAVGVAVVCCGRDVRVRVAVAAVAAVAVAAAVGVPVFFCCFAWFAVRFLFLLCFLCFAGVAAAILRPGGGEPEATRGNAKHRELLNPVRIWIIRRAL